jgi:hypothetical protein
MSIRLSYREHNDNDELFVVELYDSDFTNPVDYQAIRKNATAVEAVNDVQLMLARNKVEIQ